MILYANAKRAFARDAMPMFTAIFSAVNAFCAARPSSFIDQRGFVMSSPMLTPAVTIFPPTRFRCHHTPNATLQTPPVTPIRPRSFRRAQNASPFDTTSAAEPPAAASVTAPGAITTGAIGRSQEQVSSARELTARHMRTTGNLNHDVTSEAQDMQITKRICLCHGRPAPNIELLTVPISEMPE